jgi:adenosylhomocysteinase
MDAEVARLKLLSFGINIESMTAEQAEYVSSWKHGT